MDRLSTKCSFVRRVKSYVQFAETETIIWDYEKVKLVDLCLVIHSLPEFHSSDTMQSIALCHVYNTGTISTLVKFGRVCNSNLESFQTTFVPLLVMQYNFFKSKPMTEINFQICIFAFWMRFKVGVCYTKSNRCRIKIGLRSRNW